MARVFVSHASEDLAVAFELHRWLVEAGHEVFLDQHLHDGIAVGEQWRQQLHERLRWTNAVVCVVTSAYMASQWCTAEVNMALSHGNRLLPVRAEPDVSHALLNLIQYTDLTVDRAAARAALIEALQRIESAGDPEWPDDRSPFPGLRPFDIDRHRVFFGRGREINQLAGLLHTMPERAQNTALLVVGPSGCGKSSLVRAGLAPVMAGEPGWWTLPVMVPGSAPVSALARGLAAAAARVGLAWTSNFVHTQLDTKGLHRLVEDLLLAAPGDPQRLLVTVDQGEELFTQAGPAARARFVELLAPTLTGPVQLVATLRSESLDHLLADSALSQVPAQVYTVRPLCHEALREVIEEPARLAGIEVDKHLVARLIEDTDSGDALPLLAFTLAQLGDGVSRGGQLSSTRYEQLGGVRGALIREADAALADAVTAGGRSRAQVIAGLLRLTTVNEQGHPTRWRATRAELPAPIPIELDAFVARRLLTTDTDSGAVVIGVAHEAFLSAWPPLAKAVADNVTTLRARRAVEHAATEWGDEGQPRARLWEGGQLAATVADTGARISAGSSLPAGRRSPASWLPRRPRTLVTDRVDLSAKARDFLHASIRHDRYRRRRTVTILSVLLVLALVGAGVAVIQQRRAQAGEQATQRQLRVATARQLIAQAGTLLQSQPRTALRLGVAAESIDPGDDTRGSLLDLLSTSRYAGTLTGHTESVWSVAFAPGGHTLATASADHTVMLWDVTDPTQPRRLSQLVTGRLGELEVLAFAPDGRTLVTAGADKSVILWDVTDPAHPRRLGQPLTRDSGLVFSVAFAPDGRTLAAGSDRTVILWDVTDPAHPRRLGRPLTGHNDLVTAVAFAPEGQVLATGGNDDTVMLWNVADPAQPRQLSQPLTGHTGQVDSLAFAPDGRTLAAASNDTTVSLWNLTDPARPQRLGQPLTTHSLGVFSVAFAPDGHTLATASDDHTVILWDLTGGVQPQRLGQPLTDHTDTVYAATYAPDGGMLATASADTRVMLWDLADPVKHPRLGPPLIGHTGIVFTAAFAPDGLMLATGSSDKTVILWDLTDPARPRRIGQPLTHADWPNSVAFAPDGRTLATANGITVILWDVTDPAHPQRIGQPLRLPGPTNYVYSVAFTPDGHTLATASEDHMVILWNVTDPARPRQLAQSRTDHTARVYSVAFSPDGRTMATGSDDTTVILWNVADPAHPYRLGQPLTAHTGTVSSVAFAPDRRTLATAGDTIVILWDLADPTQPRQVGQPLTPQAGAAFSVAFAPNGRTLATASQKHTAILWDLTSFNNVRDHAAQRACSIARGGLSRDEWNRYIRQLPYQKTCPA